MNRDRMAKGKKTVEIGDSVQLSVVGCTSLNGVSSADQMR